MLASETNKINYQTPVNDEYWDCKWVTSNSVGKAYVVAGRQLSRWGCAAAAIDDKLYLFGGRGADSRPRNSFHILDLNTNHFNLFRTVNIPKGREGHSMTAYKNLLIIFGGCEGGGNDNQPFDDVFIVDVENKTWNKPGVMGRKPAAREGHAAGVIKNYMIIYGGSGIKSLISDIHAFNLTNFEWKELEQQGDLMGSRESMSSTVVWDSMYIFGGNINENQDENDIYTNDLFQITLRGYTAVCKKLIPDSPMPPKRLSHSLSSLNNKYLILFGGESFNNALNDIWAYSIEKNAWHEIKPKTQISARMAHVCYCYKHSVIVFGGMSQDHVVKSDLAILKFGKSEINISNGSGVNPKRKFTKLLNANSRTLPTILHKEIELGLVSCNRCGHSSSSCEFLQKFPDLDYPVLNYFSRVQISASSAEHLSSQFRDPFSAMLRISDLLNTPSVSFNIVGTANIKGNQICKVLSSEILKDMSARTDGDKQSIKHLISQVPILEISTKLELSPDSIAKLCSGVCSNTLIPAFFRLSDTIVLISRTSNYLSVALLYKSDMYIPFFFAVFDNNGDPIYPCKDLMYPNMVNVYSKSHLQSSDVFKQSHGTTIYLYPKELESIVGDILYQGNSFSGLVSKLKHMQYVVAGSLIRYEKQVKEENPNKEVSFLFKSYTNLFSILIYFKKKLVYWEFKKNDRGKKAREECIVLKITDENLLSSVTGHLEWNLKTMHLFSDLYFQSKKRCLE